ncbi:MAG TPA: c-type cytochrome [Rhizomicrobium sp.]|jgi:cytochrome c oxidase cbb3-type subunit 3|nr:c-type cytochrome [Rhizomicrobium sp.]
MKQFRLLGAIILGGFALGSVAMAQPVADAVTADSKNPFANSQDAVAAGEELFGKMNCAGCHGYDLAGGMGPDLTDAVWLYGGKPGEIFLTISNGTAYGMPTWKDKLKPAEIWQLVSYIQSKAAH